MTTKSTAEPVETAPGSVGGYDEPGAHVYLYGSHSEAIEAAKHLKGEVERRNLWCVVVKAA